MDIVERLRTESVKIGPYRTGAKIFSDYLKERREAASEITRLREENKVLREALKSIAASTYGLQGVQEDYGHDPNAYNFQAMKYWYSVRMANMKTAMTALATTGGE